AEIADFAGRAELRISQSDDEVKRQLQTGTATAEGVVNLLGRFLSEDYPLIQGANKLLRETEQIDESVKWLQVQTDGSRIDAIEGEAAGFFKEMDATSKGFASFLRSRGKARLEGIQQEIAKLKSSVLGPDGLFAIQREVLGARMEIGKARETLDRVERAYVGI